MFFTQSHFNRPEGVDDVSKLTKEVMVQRLEQFIGTQGEANSLEHLKMGLLPQEETGIRYSKHPSSGAFAVS